ncbi:MAG: ferrous iron transport protein A [Anaerotignum sp.]|nr:ferrous iron transport protein A [Anaerotignum sp.]MBR3910806.1 ferrous iron transport protein A [Anaerotignum sp.]MBR3993082.1 ferrous iron transport protein A [Anaerotignum sp.]MBR6651792.1 ferrous iron transport protein A [Anaerotignum sp.]
MKKKITDIPVKQSCFVMDVTGEGKLRLFDLGFFRGSRVLPLYECCCGGTRVYRVKDTLIALRNRDAEQISVEEGLENG